MARTPHRLTEIPDPCKQPLLEPEEAFPFAGVSRTKGYELLKAGLFPFPVLKVGSRYKVPTAPLLAALGLDA